MAETLKTEQQMLDSITNNQEQSNTFQDLRDIVYSMGGVGASEGETGGTPSGSEAGKGLTKLSGRRFQIDVGADGLYKFDAEGQYDIDIQANVNVAIVKNDISSGEGAPDYVFKRNASPGAKNQASNHVYLFELHECVEGDIIELQFQAAGGASVSDVDYVFSGFRIG